MKTKQLSPAEARQRAVDTGMALTLVCLILGLWRGNTGWFAAATAVLVLNMTWPVAYAPASRLWFGFSELLGSVMSKVILSLAFYAVVTPMAFAIRILGKDPLRLKAFKSGTGSAFHTRSGAFTPKDLSTPF